MPARVIMSLPRERDSVPAIRDAFAAVLRTGGLDDSEVTDLSVAMSELCTNAILHGGGPTLTVEFSLEGDTVSVCVIDDGPGFDLPDEVTMPEPGSAGGRGLAIVAALVGDLSATRLPRRGLRVEFHHRVGATSSRRDAPAVADWEDATARV